MSDYHTPVLLREAIDGLAVTRGKTYIDATAGGGGHTRQIWKHGGTVIAIDQDPEAIEEVKRQMETEGVTFRPMPDEKDKTLQYASETCFIVLNNFSRVKDVIRAVGTDSVAGILFDLGVSSHQIDSKERGFSYRFLDAPLDLRMNSSGQTAADILGSYSENELYELFARWGEIRESQRLAHALVGARHTLPIRTIGDLNAVIEQCVHTQSGVLSQVYQALRIEVNDELGMLKLGLAGAKDVLVSGGRLAVISFHSLEDRVVKQYMKTDGWRSLTKDPIVPSEDEIAQNRRARSAKLRIAEKL